MGYECEKVRVSNRVKIRACESRYSFGIARISMTRENVLVGVSCILSSVKSQKNRRNFGVFDRRLSRGKNSFVGRSKILAGYRSGK